MIRKENSLGVFMSLVISMNANKLKRDYKESEEKYRNIVETANEGIWIIDAEARTTYVNEKMAEMLGCSQEEMIGRYVMGLYRRKR